MRPALDQMQLRILWRHAFVFDQPTDHNGGTSRSTRFAMDIHDLPMLSMLLQKLNTLASILKTRRIEIDRRQPKLFDPKSRIFLQRSAVFATHVDHPAHALVRHPGNIPPQWQRSQDHMFVNTIPPIPPMKHASHPEIPNERRQEQGSGKEWVHGLIGTKARKDVFGRFYSPRTPKAMTVAYPFYPVFLSAIPNRPKDGYEQSI
jgi:hypothetical protein